MGFTGRRATARIVWLIHTGTLRALRFNRRAGAGAGCVVHRARKDSQP